MVAARPMVPFTEREYLALEAVAETKHEFFDGQIIGMAGAETKHVELVANIVIAFGAAAHDGPCRVGASDQRVKAEATASYFYPDVVVWCDEPRYSDEKPRSMMNPTALFEVSSPSTASYDRNEKWFSYRRIPSLDDYFVVSTSERQIEHYQRAGDVWRYSEHRDGVVTLKSGVTLALDAIYRRIVLDAET